MMTESPRARSLAESTRGSRESSRCVAPVLHRPRDGRSPYCARRRWSSGDTILRFTPSKNQKPGLTPRSTSVLTDPARGVGRMTPRRWRRIGELFEAAVRIDPAGREAWLRRLRRER